MIKIEHQLQKLLDIDKQLGGNQQFDFNRELEEKDEFKVKQSVVQKTLLELMNKVESKDEIISEKGKCTDSIRLDVEIRNHNQEVEKMMIELNEVLRHQSKKIRKDQYEKKEQVYRNLKEQFNNLQNYDKKNESNQNNSRSKKGQQVKTLTEMKSQLLGDQMNLQKRKKQMNQNQQAGQDELDFYDRVKENDKIMDQKAEQITAGAQILKQHAISIGQKQDVVTDKVGTLTKIVASTNSTIQTQNQKIKSIITKYRAPSMFCMDICLLLILIILIAIMAKMLI